MDGWMFLECMCARACGQRAPEVSSLLECYTDRICMVRMEAGGTMWSHNGSPDAYNAWQDDDTINGMHTSWNKSPVYYTFHTIDVVLNPGWKRDDSEPCMYNVPANNNDWPTPSKLRYITTASTNIRDPLFVISCMVLHSKHHGWMLGLTLVYQLAVIQSIYIATNTSLTTTKAAGAIYITSISQF